jgi:hypothetical protein
MRVTQAFRFELDPNCAARVALAKHVGAARFAYNWGLARCLQALEQGLPLPSAAQLHKEWNRWKRQHAPWWVEVSKCAPQEALRDLERAFRNWRHGRAGRPRFKRKKSLDDNTARLSGSIRVYPRHVQLPRIGKVRTKERTEKLLALVSPGKARILSATVAREADRWYVSLTCEVERPDPPPGRVSRWAWTSASRRSWCYPTGRGWTRPGRWRGRCGFSAAGRASLPGSRRGQGTTPRRPCAWPGCTAGCAASAGTSCSRSPRGWRRPGRSSWWRTLACGVSGGECFPGPWPTRVGAPSGGCSAPGGTAHSSSWRREVSRPPGGVHAAGRWAPGFPSPAGSSDARRAGWSWTGT